MRESFKIMSCMFVTFFSFPSIPILFFNIGIVFVCLLSSLFNKNHESLRFNSLLPIIIFNYERTTLKSKLVTLALNMSQMKGIGPEDLEKVVVLF